MNIISMLMRSTVIIFLFFLLMCLYQLNGVSSDLAERLLIGDEDVVVMVDTTEPLNHIEEYFISFNIDCQEFSEHFEKMNFRLIYIWTSVCCFSSCFSCLHIFVQ